MGSRASSSLRGRRLGVTSSARCRSSSGLRGRRVVSACSIVAATSSAAAPRSSIRRLRCLNASAARAERTHWARCTDARVKGLVIGRALGFDVVPSAHGWFDNDHPDSGVIGEHRLSGPLAGNDFGRVAMDHGDPRIVRRRVQRRRLRVAHRARLSRAWRPPAWPRPSTRFRTRTRGDLADAATHAT